MNRIAAVFVSAALTLLIAPPAAAQKPDKDKPQKSTDAVQVAFSTAERQLIVEFFSAHPHEVQPLPPGIAKNLARGKALPPGIAKQQVPPALIEQLPSREEFEVTIFGDRIVLLEASGLVVDVLEGIFR